MMPSIGCVPNGAVSSADSVVGSVSCSVDSSCSVGWVCAVSCAGCFAGMVDCPAGKTNTNAPMLTIASNKAHNSEVLRFIAFSSFLWLFFGFYYTIPGYVVL